MSGRSPPLYCTLTLIAMQGHQTKTKLKHCVVLYIIKYVKGAVYTVLIFICICMSLRVFLFAKKMKFLTKGGIHCISQVFPSHFCFMREHSLAELTEHDDSAANIIVHSMYTYMYCCIHST